MTSEKEKKLRHKSFWAKMIKNRFNLVQDALLYLSEGLIIEAEKWLTSIGEKHTHTHEWQRRNAVESNAWGITTNETSILRALLKNKKKQPNWNRTFVIKIRSWFNERMKEKNRWHLTCVTVLVYEYNMIPQNRKEKAWFPAHHLI
jgi:hypothetical protein